jgi:membrane protease YdiL (CAAX protease family)
MATEDTAAKLVVQLVGYGGLLALTLIAARQTGSDVGLWQPGQSRLGQVLFAFALLTVVVRFFIKQPLAGWPDKLTADWLSIAEAYLVGRLLVPAFEEVLFRGLLWASLVQDIPSSGWRPSVPTLITAAMFGGLHWPGLYGLPSDGAWPIVLSAAAGGVLFGVLRQRTGSIQAGIALHIIGNTIGF